MKGRHPTMVPPLFPAVLFGRQIVSGTGIRIGVGVSRGSGALCSSCDMMCDPI